MLDSLAWLAALYLASTIRLETFHTSPALTIGQEQGRIPVGGWFALSALAAFLHVLAAWRLRLHQGRSVIGGFEEMFLLTSVVAWVGCVVTMVNVLVPDPLLARTTPAAASCIALIFCAWPRGLWRILIQDPRSGRLNESSERVIVAGAGEAGRQLVLSMQRDADRRWIPVGFVDEDQNKRHFRFRGIPVLGALDAIEQVAAQTAATSIVIAMPNAGAEAVSRIFHASRAAGLVVKVLPGIDALLAGVDQNAVRDIQPEDFLGRHPIETDVNSISGQLRGKRVLVTGAGGSIGSELCRQITAFGPAELILLDRDESALHTLLLSLSGRADLESPDVVLANVREPDRIRDIFEARRPQVVFHAAALKHVNILETHAAEAVKTNVIGTLNVLEAAAAVGVERFVNISTDKAADPISVLGYSKRIAEGLTAAVAANSDGTFLSVRFGNVLGTSGSVLKTFAAQIETGGPVTVTSPDVTRYFMTVHEAVQLVIQAAAIGRDGEALVLDMGAPVRIVDVARQMIEAADGSIEIIFTGMKPGEKMHEVLLGAAEQDVRPFHPLISHVDVPTVTRDEALTFPRGRDNDATVRDLSAMAARMQLRLQQAAKR